MTDLLTNPFETPVSSWFNDPYFLGCSAFFIASFLAVRMFPVIIYLCEHKNLMDLPGERKVHQSRIPNLGGVGIFVAFTMSCTAIGSFIGLEAADMNKLLALLSAVIILFFLGVKDDIIGLSPTKKFLGQLLAALAVIVLTDVRIHSLQGLLGLHELPYIASVFFTLFVFLLVVNAYNLIDGIDGLAGSVALLASASFGLFFLIDHAAAMVLVAFLLMGALRGFLRFNLAEDHKVFMGDSGSLFIGFVLAYQAIMFLQINGAPDVPHPLPNGPILVLAILSFPLMDTLRVFVLRVREGRSPFSADMNHIHHRLLGLGLGHKQATFLVVFLNLLVIGGAFLIRDLNINLQLLIMLALVPLLFSVPFLLLSGSSQPAYREQYSSALSGSPVGDRTSMYVPEAPNRQANMQNVPAAQAAHGPVRNANTASGNAGGEQPPMQRIIEKRLAAIRKMLGTPKEKV